MVNSQCSCQSVVWHLICFGSVAAKNKYHLTSCAILDGQTNDRNMNHIIKLYGLHKVCVLLVQSSFMVSQYSCQSV